MRGEGAILAHDLSLKVGAGKADLVVEPDVHAQFARVGAHTEEDRPPLLRKERRIVGVAAIERTGRRQIEHDQVVDAALSKALELPAQALRIKSLATPPPDRYR